MVRGSGDTIRTASHGAALGHKPCFQLRGCLLFRFKPRSELNQLVFCFSHGCTFYTLDRNSKTILLPNADTHPTCGCQQTNERTGRIGIRRTLHHWCASSVCLLTGARSLCKFKFKV